MAFIVLLWLNFFLYQNWQQLERNINIFGNYLQRKPTVVMMCASPGTIREIMLAADDLKMIDSGEYVFFNIELYTG